MKETEHALATAVDPSFGSLLPEAIGYPSAAHPDGALQRPKRQTAGQSLWDLSKKEAFRLLFYRVLEMDDFVTRSR